MSQFRVYFYNLTTRTEMTDFDGNGKTWLSLGGMVRDASGEYIPDTTDRVGFANYASMRSVSGEREVTADDFDHPVAVKVWFGPGRIEWRKLVKQEVFTKAA